MTSQTAELHRELIMRIFLTQSARRLCLQGVQISNVHFFHFLSQLILNAFICINMSHGPFGKKLDKLLEEILPIRHDYFKEYLHFRILVLTHVDSIGNKIVVY